MNTPNWFLICLISLKDTLTRTNLSKIGIRFFLLSEKFKISVRHFLTLLQGNCVQLLTDNTTVVACIRHQGTLRSPALMNLSKTLLEFCFAHSVSLVPKHLSGALNVLAEQGSRSTEWSLDAETFAWVASNFGPLQVDPPIAEASSHPWHRTELWKVT